MLRGVMPHQHLHVLAVELAVRHRAVKRGPRHHQLGTDLLVEMLLRHVSKKQIEVHESIGAKRTTQRPLIRLRLLLRGRS